MEANWNQMLVSMATVHLPQGAADVDDMKREEACERGSNSPAFASSHLSYQDKKKAAFLGGKTAYSWFPWSPFKFLTFPLSHGGSFNQPVMMILL